MHAASLRENCAALHAGKHSTVCRADRPRIEKGAEPLTEKTARAPALSCADILAKSNCGTAEKVPRALVPPGENASFSIAPRLGDCNEISRFCLDKWCGGSASAERPEG